MKVTMERGLRENPTCRQPDLGFAASSENKCPIPALWQSPAQQLLRLPTNLLVTQSHRKVRDRMWAAALLKGLDLAI